MKQFLVALVLATISTSSLAHGYYGNNNDWVGPLLIGGAVGYMMAQPRVVYVQPSPRVITVEPVYQYMWITDPQCGCQKQILIQVTN